MNYYLKEYLALKKHFKCWLLLFSIKSSSLNSRLYHGWKIYCYLNVGKSCKLFNDLTKLGRRLWHHMNYWDSETSACIKSPGCWMEIHGLRFSLGLSGREPQQLSAVP